MSMGRVEDMVYREVLALAGDLNQIGILMVESHEQRLKEAEELQRGHKTVAMPMRAVDRPALVKDLSFIKSRLDNLIGYVRGEGEK